VKGRRDFGSLFFMVHLKWTIKEEVMPATPSNTATIGVTAFKSKCLGLIDDVAQGKTDRIVLLKHNRPIAAIVPIASGPEDDFDLWGAMRGTVTIAPGVDLTEGTGEVWDAEQ
jgi:antitoxin (DNA-binding transcriptional repressor) of toxin-antitoxin stability system